MALTPQIRAPQAGILAAVEQTAQNINVPQAGILAVYNIPAESIRATSAGIIVGVRKTADIQVPQAGIMVAARGRIANPRVRVWTFTLDMHDFYVLKLGDGQNLVYDRYSEQWMEWGDLNQIYWRANCGVNWEGGSKFGPEYGSNVVVGDDTYGLIWFLDPDQAADDHPDYLATNQTIYFDRIVMGQVMVKAREAMPCFAVWLTTDMGLPAYTGAGVTLSTSDDAGATFDDHGTVTVTMGENSPQLSWYSLGQIEAPGRLFKIVDDGAVARIDALEMNDS